MYVEQIFTACLAEMAYYIESNGEAAIIDPLRETGPYLEMANKRGAKIKYVFLTHFHADFVSGHVDLAKKTGATIVFGPNATTQFDFHSGTDGEVFKVGDLQLKLIHTPGHTMESSSYLLIDEEGNTPSIFTGDCLFIGDVGRPDLAVKSDLTATDLAQHLFDSLRNKIMTLPNEIIVYPAHGAGSSCGKNMSTETFDTLGHQKESNYALRADMTKEEFVKEVTNGLSTPPQYFPKNVGMNKGINKEYDTLLNEANKPLTVTEFERLAATPNTLIMDVRHENDFVKGFIKGAVFFGLDGSFAPWVGTIIEDLNTPILLVCPEGLELEAITRLSRVGYDNVQGYLNGGYKTWEDAEKETDYIESISPEDFSENHYPKDITIIDVRKDTEYNSEHIEHENVTNLPLADVLKNHSAIKSAEKTYIHCRGGYRSVIYASIVKQKGIKNPINIAGGFDQIKAQKNMKLTAFICPTTL
jgi:glyoxylase-like metal-dependent hydrolase (beta-lactamase superfamily II)/rhodanese-related sulfurtransferase